MTGPSVPAPLQLLQSMQAFLVKERDDLLFQGCDHDLATGQPIRSTLRPDVLPFVEEIETLHAEISNVLHPPAQIRRPWRHASLRLLNRAAAR